PLDVTQEEGRRCFVRPVTSAAGLAGRSVRRVAHVVGESVEPLPEVGPEVLGHLVFGERAVHAPEPFVALAGADREGEMAHAEPGVAEPLYVELWAAGPAAEEDGELFA